MLVVHFVSDLFCVVAEVELTVFLSFLAKTASPCSGGRIPQHDPVTQKLKTCWWLFPCDSGYECENNICCSTGTY